MKCTDCEYKRALSNPKTGKKIPGTGNGKCIREGGFCDEMASVFSSDLVVAKDEGLPPQEAKRLQALEMIIKDNIVGFFRVGNALREIREQQLYRAEFDTFEEYCQIKWDMGRNYANRNIVAVQVVENLKEHGANWHQNEEVPNDDESSLSALLPANEAQARPLTALGSEAQIMVWKKVVEKAQGKRITGALVARTAAEMTKGFAQKKLETKTERIAREEVFSKPFRRGFQTFLDEVEKARASEWKETSKQAALKHLDELRKIVAES